MKKLFAILFAGLMLVSTSVFAGGLTRIDVQLFGDDCSATTGGAQLSCTNSPGFFGDFGDITVTNDAGDRVYYMGVMHLGEITTILPGADATFAPILKIQFDALGGTQTVRLDTTTESILYGDQYGAWVVTNVEYAALPSTPEESVTVAQTALADAIATGDVTVQASMLENVLANADRQMLKDNLVPTIKMLEAFIAEINDQLADGTIDPAVAANLLELAENALALL